MRPRANALGAVVLGTLALATAACTAPGVTPPPGTPKPFNGPLPEPTAVAAGQTLLAQKGCGGCHVIPGVPGAAGVTGPNLAGVGSRPTLAGGAVPHSDATDLTRWLLDPPGLKPGTQMPRMNLSEDEASKMSAYLETLR